MAAEQSTWPGRAAAESGRGSWEGASASAQTTHTPAPSSHHCPIPAPATSPSILRQPGGGVGLLGVRGSTLPRLGFPELALGPRGGGHSDSGLLTRKMKGLHSTAFRSLQPHVPRGHLTVRPPPSGSPGLLPGESCQVPAWGCPIWLPAVSKGHGSHSGQLTLHFCDFYSSRSPVPVGQEGAAPLAGLLGPGRTALTA